MTENSVLSLVAERRGPHLLVRQRDEDDPAARFPWPPAVAGQLFVLVSPAAGRDPACAGALAGLAGPELRADGVKVLRLGLPRLGARPEAAQQLADELEAAVLVPDGGFLVRPGAALYTGPGTGGTGWQLFRPGKPAGFGGLRYPQPAWEAALPARSSVLGEVVADPVPAGVLVRGVDSAPPNLGDPVAGLPVDQRAPKVIVGRHGEVPSPAAITDVLRKAPEPSLLVPAEPAAAAYAWLAEVALRLGREVLVGIGRLATTGPDETPRDGFDPFVTVLKQPAGGGDQVVLDVAVPPAGWERSGRATYRLGEVRVDVVPSGLVVRTGPADPAATALPFDPSGWTLQLGTPGEPVGKGLLSAAEKLMAGLDPVRRRRARVRVAGVPDEAGKRVLGSRGATLPGGSAPGGAVPSPGGPGFPDGDVPRAWGKLPGGDVPRGGASLPGGVMPGAGVPVPGGGAPQPGDPSRNPGPDTSASPVPRPSASAVAPPIAMMSSVPVPTVSGKPGGPAPVRESTPLPVPPPAAPRRDVPAAGTASPRPEPTAPPVAPLAEVAPEPVAPAPVPPPASAPPPKPSGPRAAPLAVSDRASSAAEQASFTTAAGDEFSEALATVNTALATWPSMRQEDTAGVKADYAAVCLFLGSGDGGSQAVNGAVRAGQDSSMAGQLACLSSGIRRLPTHRRPVLRQSRTPEPVQPGTLQVEPGFLTASLDLDITVSGAELDVLIWPSSARRTSELLGGRTPDEVVFGAGSRFKALAVRQEGGEGEASPDRDGPEAPRIAVLLRELAPGEEPGESGELDERDLAVLDKLDRVLARRRQNKLRLVDTPDVVTRLTSPLLEWDAETTESDRSGGGHTAVMAS
ncbi:hypothetical protein [Amycolatopsis sp. WQ 127309]|uniref:hypothetical protein n=1 Tax=Amycolatopsis sp. WQ 127309 TaxID=2932773 RepID=UPI001FF6F1FD|nr:hypothetical protein [Amycolatopsis sp. WQ 127309]UOZ06958.1 hypothetical protein MUY22_01290 [Amycolatopsis sp. WQ 127309]